MTNPIALLLVLFGCNDDLSQCERISVEAVTYLSTNACRNQQSVALKSNSTKGADYPTVVAYCLTPDQVAGMGSKNVNLSK